jgi:hypothetical protein
VKIPASGLHFISEDNLFDPNSPQIVTRTGRKVQLTLTVMKEAAPDPLPAKLRGMLFHPQGWKILGGAHCGRIETDLVRRTPGKS